MNDLELAAVAAAFDGAPPRTFRVDPDARIQLSEGTGHLLTGATITEWARD